MRAPALPAILKSPDLEFIPAAWPRAALELRLWRTDVSPARQVWAVVSLNGVLWLRRVVCEQTRNSKDTEYQNLIDAAQVQMPADTFKVLVADLAAISFPAFVPRAMGCDGESHGVERNGFPSNVAVSWWGGAPTGWKALAQWHANCEHILDALLPQVPAHFNIGYRASKRPSPGWVACVTKLPAG
jgi:hypothetical protein